MDGAAITALPYTIFSVHICDAGAEVNASQGLGTYSAFTVTASGADCVFGCWR
jgi:hypothetical protein